MFRIVVFFVVSIDDVSVKKTNDTFFEEWQPFLEWENLSFKMILRCNNCVKRLFQQEGMKSHNKYYSRETADEKEPLPTPAGMGRDPSLLFLHFPSQGRVISDNVPLD